MPWSAVAAAPGVDFGYAPSKFRMTCCDKAGDGSDDVDFFRCRSGPEVFHRAAALA